MKFRYFYWTVIGPALAISLSAAVVMVTVWHFSPVAVEQRRAAKIQEAEAVNRCLEHSGTFVKIDGVKDCFLLNRVSSVKVSDFESTKRNRECAEVGIDVRYIEVNNFWGCYRFERVITNE